MYSLDLVNRISNKRLNGSVTADWSISQWLNIITVFIGFRQRCFFRWIKCSVLCNKNCYQVLFRANLHPVPLSVRSKCLAFHPCSPGHFSPVLGRS